MQQVDVERSQEFRKCIECFLCQDTCHVIRDHEENKEAFAGPRFLMRDRRARHAPARRAGRPAERRRRTSHGLGFCNITKCCTEVCPEHIKITDNALIPMKERVVDRKYDPVRLARQQDPPPRVAGSARLSVGGGSFTLKEPPPTGTLSGRNRKFVGVCGVQAVPAWAPQTPTNFRFRPLSSRPCWCCLPG